MKIWVLSDLHLDFEDMLPIPPADADVCIVAGDILQGVANSVHWLATYIAPSMPVIFVPGNHEFYQDSILEGREWGRVAADQVKNVHLLDDTAVTIGGVRFIGATLWTDYALDGRGQQEVAWAKANAEGRLNDHRVIAWRRMPSFEAFTPDRAHALHQRSREFLRTELRSLTRPRATVVVTHHAPHPQSVHPRYKGSSLNPGFASDLSEMMELYRPALWAHGHMHDSLDYRVRDTRVVCNPKGYFTENAAFDASLVVEVGEWNGE